MPDGPTYEDCGLVNPYTAKAEIERLRAYIRSLDGKHIGTRTDGNTFVDEGVIVAADILGPSEQSRRCNYPDCDGGPATGKCHKDCEPQIISE